MSAGPVARSGSRFFALLIVSALLASCAIERPPASAPGSPPGGARPAPGSPGYTPPVGAPVPDAPEGLQGLYDGLDRLRAAPSSVSLASAGPGPGQDEKLRVLILGDSHVAGGVITQRLRERFQADFGDGGRGPMVVGLPYAGRREADWKLTHAGEWAYDNSLRSASTGPFGLTGFIARSRSAGASLTLTSAADGAVFDEVEISFIRRPGAGAIEVRVDDRQISRLETDGPAPTADRALLPVPPGSRKLELRATDRRPVELLSWGVERHRKGVIVEGHGISGATAWVMGKWDPVLLSEDLRRRAPALILLAFGTNEGFQNNFDVGRYSADYAALIRLIREAAPRAAIVLVGPPDAARRAGRVPNAPRGCEWATPANLFAARSAQQQLAASMGIAFWDWSGLMNGPCGVHDWVTRHPPLARPDHVHLTYPGYTATADALYQDIVGPYLAARSMQTQLTSR